MFSALAKLADRRPKRVVVVTVAMAVVAAVLGGTVAKHLYPYGADDPASESVKADKRLEHATGLKSSAGLIAIVKTPAGVQSAQARARVNRVERELRSERDVGRVTSYLESRDPAMVSRDRHSTYVVANFKRVSDKTQQDAAKRLVDRFGSLHYVTLGGNATANVEVNKQVEHDLRRAELLAFPLLFLLSLLFFRSAVAALLPLLVGGLAIVGTFLTLRIASEATEVSVFALNLTTGLGLGLAIDYSLFIVTRYREELARSGPGLQALRNTLATAGRSVLFSSLTVAAALASLLIFPQRFLYSMGIGGASVALIAAAVALVVLPAVLALLGTRVNALSPKFLQRRADREARGEQTGFWYRLSRFVMRRPGRIAVTTAALLIAMGIPFFSIQFTSIDATVLPAGASARSADAALKHEFPPHRDTPIYLVVGASPAEAATLAVRLRDLPGVAAVSPPRAVGPGLSRIDVISSSGALSSRSQRLVRNIRSEPAAYRVQVAGRTADFIDQKASLTSHLVPAFAIVIIATLVVLFLMTGSVILPIKQLVMNVLTLSATFGLLVLIFQDGRFEKLLNYSSQGALEMSMPVLLFAVAFGLSTDYGVFLLSRIKEARDAGAPDNEAVAIGLERTGRIVTAAALLFSVAIGAFATSEIVFIKENGVGTALAVLIDATLIRALLVPSLMELLGKWNWWAPAPLRRLHRRIGLSEGISDGAQQQAPARAG